MDEQKLLNSIKSAKVVNVAPGDLVVVSFDANLADDEYSALSSRLKAVFPGAKVLLLLRGELSVYRHCESYVLSGEAE